MSRRVNRPVPGGPYETEQQARTDVDDVYEHCRRSAVQGAPAEASLAHLLDASERAGVALGAFDGRILSWLAHWEPETCAVVAGLITRAHASGASGQGRHR